jgi:hypothetical protein
LRDGRRYSGSGRRRQREDGGRDEVSCPKRSNYFYIIPGNFLSMALPHSEVEPGDLSAEEKKKATFRLILTILVIDTIAITGYFVLVFAFGWDAMTPLIPLLVISVITGMYFQQGKQKIEG